MPIAPWKVYLQTAHQRTLLAAAAADNAANNGVASNEMPVIPLTERNVAEFCLDEREAKPNPANVIRCWLNNVVTDLLTETRCAPYLQLFRTRRLERCWPWFRAAGLHTAWFADIASMVDSLQTQPPFSELLDRLRTDDGVATAATGNSAALEQRIARWFLKELYSILYPGMSSVEIEIFLEEDLSPHVTVASALGPDRISPMTVLSYALQLLEPWCYSLDDAVQAVNQLILQTVFDVSTKHHALRSSSRSDVLQPAAALNRPNGLTFEPLLPSLFQQSRSRSRLSNESGSAVRKEAKPAHHLPLLVSIPDKGVRPDEKKKVVVGVLPRAHW
jgi:hypothetical protein